MCGVDIDDTYHGRGLGSISFHMPLGDFLELGNVIFVLELKNNIIFISCMIDV